jgi:hypothetical protein
MYYNAPLQETQKLQTMFNVDIVASSPGNETWEAEYGVPVLFGYQSTNAALSVHPTQAEIDEFLGVPGDIFEAQLDEVSCPVDVCAMVLNMNGQVRRQNKEGAVYGYATIEDDSSGILLDEVAATGEYLLPEGQDTNSAIAKFGVYVSQAGNILLKFNWLDVKATAKPSNLTGDIDVRCSFFWDSK